MRIQPLIAQAREATLRWPGLWLPALMINAFQGLALTQLSLPALQWVIAICANLGTFMMGAGWLQMIGRALDKEPPRYTDFLDGVNRRWGALVAGNIAFYLLLGGLLASFAYWGDQHYRFDTLQHWAEMVQAMKPAQLQKALDPAAIPAPVRGWLKLCLIWIALAAVAAFALLFWQPLVVLRGRSWWSAWAGSAKLAFTQGPRVLALVALQLGGLFLASTLSATGNALFVLAGLGLALFVSIYFTVLYAAVVNAVYPVAPAPGSTIDLDA